MKRIFALFVVMTVLCVTVVQAGEDRGIPPEQLPQEIKVFLSAHFSNEKIALVKMEKEFWSTEYKVYLVGGTKIEFGKDNEWKEIDCEYGEVPTSIIPPKIQHFVKANYPNQKIIQLKKNGKRKKKYEIELDNSMEIEFDNDFNVVDIDQ